MPSFVGVSQWLLPLVEAKPKLQGTKKPAACGPDSPIHRDSNGNYGSPPNKLMHCVKRGIDATISGWSV